MRTLSTETARAEDFGLPSEEIAEGKQAGLQVVVSREVGEEPLPVEGEGGVIGTKCIPVGHTTLL